MLRILLVGLAGLAGTLSRYWLSGALARRYGEDFPTGTLAVNLLGLLMVCAGYALAKFAAGAWGAA